MDTPEIGVVVLAYNRPHTFSRLLRSLSRADFPLGREPVLMLSLEADADPAVLRLAREYEWPGAKEVVVHDHHKGLRDHVIWCGDQTDRFDAVIVLEDDLVVSPFFHSYAVSAYQAYEGSDAANEVASYSLYSFLFNDVADLPFTPVHDGNDSYFIQTCSSWGQMWSARQWKRFRAWYDENKDLPVTEDDGLPQLMVRWADTSWKKYFNKYMLAEKLFSVVPRVSLSTNFADPGTHKARQTNVSQVPLLLGEKRWSFPTLAQSIAVYDIFYEPDLERLATDIGGVPVQAIDCDLYGTKPLGMAGKEYRLSTRDFAGTPLASFGDRMTPPVLNVLYGVPGDAIRLGDTRTFGDKLDYLRMLRRESEFVGGRRNAELAIRALKKRV